MQGFPLLNIILKFLLSSCDTYFSTIFIFQIVEDGIDMTPQTLLSSDQYTARYRNMFSNCIVLSHKGFIKGSIILVCMILRSVEVFAVSMGLTLLAPFIM